MMSQRYFAVISPGLEEALSDELKQFRTRKRQIVEGGVLFEATNIHFYRVMLHSRLASRVYLRIDSFRARDPQELYRKSRRIDWPRLLKPDVPIEVVGSSRASRIFGSGAVAERVQDAIADTWREQGVDAATDTGYRLKLLARLDRDQCTLSLDASGALMHRRGWRLATGHAPLRENCAAALLRLAGWVPGMPLVDPMCGSGTFVIEAARMMAGLPPRTWDAYGFHHWAHFDLERWAAVLEESHATQGSGADVGDDRGPISLWGNDRDAAVITAARENAARAEVEGLISFACGDAMGLEPPCEGPGLLICNPPYGARLSRKGPGQAAIEQRLIDRCAEVFGGWSLAILLPSDVTPARDGLDFVELARFRNGGIPVRLWSCAL